MVLLTITLERISIKLLMDNLNDAVATPNKTVQDATPSPWSIWTVFIIGLLSLGTATIFLVWRSFIQIKEYKAGQIFITVALVLQIIVGCVSILLSNWGIYGASLMFAGIGLPIWFYESHLKHWEQQHPGVNPKFSLSIIGWGILGLIFSVVLLLTIDVVIAGVLQSNTFSPN